MTPLGLNIKLTHDAPLALEICNLAFCLIEASREGKMMVLRQTKDGPVPAQIHLIFAIEGDGTCETVEFDIPVFVVVGSRPQVLAQWLLRRFTEIARRG